MTTYNLLKGTAARGLAVDDQIYYTTCDCACLHTLFDNDICCAPQPIGGICKYQNDFLCGSYATHDSKLYRLTRDGQVRWEMDYLQHIPPLYLPIDPYTHYVTGIAIGKRDSFWLSLQNSKFIYNISFDGEFRAARQVPLKENGDPIDLTGISISGHTMYLLDIAESKVYCQNMTFGGVTVISLPQKFEPFGVDYYGGSLYVISANFFSPQVIQIPV